ncbi:MAG: hypothetical protein IKD20_05965, partial [Clostridia bacterium]|nr:hypothetical protein [Clostridia bacterium]
MKKDNNSTPNNVNIFSVLSSKTTRNAIIIVMLILSIFGMIMIDESNFIRTDYFAFLESNIAVDFMTIFGIERFNISSGAWVLFFAIFLVILILLVGNMVERQVLKDKPGILNKVWYYLSLVLICGAVVFVAYMLGAFEEVSKSADVLANLLYTLLLCLILVLIIPVLIVALLYLIKGAIIAIRWLIKFFMSTSSAKTVAIEDTVTVSADGIEGVNFGDSSDEPLSTEQIFPALVRIDNAPLDEPVVNVDITLEQLALQFQSYAIHHHQIYYGLPLIRSFVAGLATSRLLILEGLSGTGKSMLPRLFTQFTNSTSFFSPVQATWRDKTDVLGFYSEFAKTFKSTGFLESLYKASYSDKANIMVLDEMNLSRIEYYFADFLSVIEYPAEEWKIRIYEPQVGQVLPAKLPDGYVRVPTNTWFVGTANTDDSTFIITDKVYDRAIIIDFAEKVLPIESDYCSDDINLSAEGLTRLFEEAQRDSSKCLTSQEIEKFYKLCDFMSEKLDVRFGNRIMVQIENFVPVYVALGGSKEEALDFMFARKVLRKADGLFGDYVKEELVNLTKLMHSLYGKGVFVESEKVIAKLTKRLG